MIQGENLEFFFFTLLIECRLVGFFFPVINNEFVAF